MVTAVKAMTDTSRFGLSPSRISVSTVGIVPRMLQMVKDMPEVGLALSLHAPTQELRVKIVPSAKAWDIEKLLRAAEAFVHNQNETIANSTTGPRQGKRKLVGQSTAELSHRASVNRMKNRRRHLLLEYVLLGPDVNCLPEHAHQLGELLSATSERLHSSLLNVIPYNPTEGTELFHVD